MSSAPLTQPNGRNSLNEIYCIGSQFASQTKGPKQNKTHKKIDDSNEITKKTCSAIFLIRSRNQDETSIPILVATLSVALGNNTHPSRPSVTRSSQRPSNPQQIQRPGQTRYAQCRRRCTCSSGRPMPRCCLQPQQTPQRWNRQSRRRRSRVARRPLQSRPTGCSRQHARGWLHFVAKVGQYLLRVGGAARAYLPVLGQIDLERFGIIFKAQRCHGKEDILTVDSLALLLLTFLGCYIHHVSSLAETMRRDGATYLRW